jgi:hypothetical protein
MTTVTPTTSNTVNNEIELMAATGNNGHSVGKLNQALGTNPTASELYSLFTGASPTFSFNATNNDNTDDFIALNFTVKGNYSFELTIGGVSKKIELVVGVQPTLKVVSAAIDTTEVSKFSGDGRYMIEEPASDAVTVTFGLENDGIVSTGKFFYKAFDTFTDLGGAAVVTTDFFVSTEGAAGIAAATPARSGIEPSASIINFVSGSPLPELTFVDGVAKADVVYANGVTTDRAIKVSKVIAVYQLNPARYAADGTPTVARYVLIGFVEFEIWQADLVA